MITLGEIIVNVEANRKAFDDAMMRLHAILNEPHTCPTCDGYGYLVRVVHQGYINHHKVDAFREVEELYDASEMVPRLGDIPCPDCNE